MAHPGDVVEAPLLGARATFLKTTEQTNGELLRLAGEPHLLPSVGAQADAQGYIVST